MRNSLIVIGVLVVVIGLIIYIRSRIPGYRGAIGFKNHSTSHLDVVRLAGFSSPIECRSLAPTEHSFNFRGRQDIPATVTVTWNAVGAASQSATLSMDSVPKSLPDGEIFFVCHDPAHWTVEHADHLQTDRL